MSRSCSQCGNNGHNSRTCGDSGGENGIMLFGVRVVEGATSFRKSASMNNLSQYDQPQEHVYGEVSAAGYESDDVVHASGRSRERKRGVPWTEEEHKLFLLGLQKVGKGDWRGISRNFVKTRTPTQVASHAQKYFLRRSNQSRRRRRSSLFDITTDNVMNSSPMDEGHVKLPPETTKLPVPQSSLHLRNNVAGFSMPAFPAPLIPEVLPATSVGSDDYSITLGPANQVATAHKSSPKKLIRPVPIIPVPPSSKMAKLNLNQSSSHEDTLLPLSLELSTPSSQDQPPAASTANHSSAFQNMSSGDSRISVA